MTIDTSAPIVSILLMRLSGRTSWVNPIALAAITILHLLRCLHRLPIHCHLLLLPGNQGVHRRGSSYVYDYGRASIKGSAGMAQKMAVDLHREAELPSVVNGASKDEKVSEMIESHYFCLSLDCIKVPYWLVGMVQDAPSHALTMINTHDNRTQSCNSLQGHSRIWPGSSSSSSKDENRKLMANLNSVGTS